MNWFKKKKEEVKEAAIKIQNKRSSFKGDGHILGGEQTASSAANTSISSAGTSSSFKLPFSSTSKSSQSISEEEQQRRREQRLKAVEVRGNAFEKRVQAARQARLREQEEAGARFDDLLETKPPPAPILNGPTVALSNEEVKARELANAQAQCGFNPYAATFSSSTEVSSIMNSVSSGPNTSGGTTMPASGNILGNSSTNYDHIPPVDTIPTANGAVFVLLRQESSLAIAAAETLTKILGNILQNPNEEKYRKIRISNASFQNKIVKVTGALDILLEAGFQQIEIDGEIHLSLRDISLSPEGLQAVKSAHDRVEVALIQLKLDTTATS